MKTLSPASARTDVAPPLRTLSLFSGIGGLELGISRAVRTRVLGYVEREAYAASILVARMEEEALDPAPLWVGDIHDLDARPLRGQVDLICGGYPCQPFSVAGRRKGEQDERHLWPEVARIIGEVGPRLVFLENVSGHLRLGFDRVLGDLANLGFDAEWTTLRASDVGAPHRRERLFVLAHGDGRGLEGCGFEERPGLEGARRLIADGCRNNGELEGEDVAHRDIGGVSCGLQQPQRTHPRGDGEGVESSWPPGPQGDWRGIPEYLHPALGTPAQRYAAQPSLRRVAHGLPNLVDAAQLYRTDRLRCLGNAVVPPQAQRAFTLLARRAGLTSQPNIPEENTTE